MTNTMAQAHVAAIPAHQRTAECDVIASMCDDCFEAAMRHDGTLEPCPGDGTCAPWWA